MVEEELSHEKTFGCFRCCGGMENYLPTPGNISYILYISRLLGSLEHHLKYHDLGRGICAIGSINSHYFHIIGDGHQPNSRGL